MWHSTSFEINDKIKYVYKNDKIIFRNISPFKEHEKRQSEID